MSREVSYMREPTGFTTAGSATVTVKQRDAPLYRRAQTAAPTKPQRQHKEKEKYLDPAEFLAQRRKLTARSRVHNRLIQSAAPGTKNYKQEKVYNIDDLIKSTEREPDEVFFTSGLKRFRLLHEIVNLNHTPLDFETLAKLQRRENEIIQTSAKKDDRYVHLVGCLQPTKRTFKPCLIKPVIYNAYQECEILATRQLEDFKAGVSHIESSAS